MLGLIARGEEETKNPTTGPASGLPGSAQSLLPSRPLSRSREDLWIALAFYLVCAIWAGYAFLFSNNPDAVSYVSIAQKYADGNIRDAINGLWSPMYCWLLVPLLLAGVPPLAATKALGGAIGAVALIAGWALARSLRFSKSSRLLLCVALVPLLIEFSFRIIEPDLLSTALVILYLAHLTRSDYMNSRASGAVSGLLGALGYLAKSYVMGFFLAHFLTVCFLNLFNTKQPKARVLGIMMNGLAAFFLIAGVWFAALSSKYHFVTTGTAGPYNHALEGPTSRGEPMNTLGLFPPPNSTALSAWEDPTFMMLPNWNPLGSKENFNYQLQLIERNGLLVLHTLQWRSEIWLVIFGLAVLLAGSAIDPEPRRPVLILLTAIAIYPLGYMTLHIETRYLLTMFIGLMILGVLLIETLGQNRFGTIRRLLATGLVCGTFMIPSVRVLWADRGEAQTRNCFLYSAAMRLTKIIPAGSAVCSDNDWEDTDCMAMYSHFRYFGQAKPGDTLEDLAPSMKRLGVQYLLVWSDPPNLTFNSDWIKKTTGVPGDPAVYIIPQ